MTGDRDPDAGEFYASEDEYRAAQWNVGDRVRVKASRDDLVESGFTAITGWRTGPGTVESIHPPQALANAQNTSVHVTPARVVVVLDEGQGIPYAADELEPEGVHTDRMPPQ